MSARSPAKGTGPDRKRTQGNLFRFRAGSRFEHCGVTTIDCPLCGVRTLADGVSVKSADGVRETHRHLRCRLCGAPSHLKDGLMLLTDGLPPEDAVYPSEAFIARSHPGLLEAVRPEPEGAAMPVEAKDAPRHLRAFLYGMRYELEKPRGASWPAYVWPIPFGGLMTIGLLSYGVMSLVSWLGSTQNMTMAVTSTVGVLLLLMGLSLRGTNLRMAAAREACAPYLWRTIARFGGTQEQFCELAGRMGPEFGWIRNALAHPMPYVALREEAAVRSAAEPHSDLGEPAAASAACEQAGSEEQRVPEGVAPGHPAPLPLSPAAGLEQAVLTALEEQPKPRSAQQGWMLLIISLVLFLSLGWLGNAVEQIALLVVLLAIHEGGHYLAMRLFGYRDVRVFFIPFLGAATTASDTQQAPQWKQAVVSLAGPLPGLAIGLLLGAGWALTGNAFLGQAALFFVLLNGFNLLPFLPLDGGHFFDHVIFCRQRVLEAVFRVLAAAGLCAIALLMGSWILVALALLPLLAISNFLKNTRIADELRREAPLPEDGLPSVPPREVALAILSRVRDVFPQIRAPKLLADQIRQVWNCYGVRPPGAGTTIL